MKACIVGSGLGGMLTACSLAKEGFEVEVYEKLPYPGGRFTNLEYKGYQLSTGALHMIPHGRNGPLGRMLKKLGAGVEIVHSRPQALFRIGGGDLGYGELIKAFPGREKVGFLKLLLSLKRSEGDKESFARWLEERFDSRLAYNLAKAYTGWALSLEPEEVSSEEVLAQVKNISRYRGPGVPVGGCRGVVSALEEVLHSHGGKIHLKSRVEGIYGKDRVEGVKVGGEKKNADLVVSNLGLGATASLAGGLFNAGYLKGMEKLESSRGIKISVACDKPMLEFSGVLFTPEAKKIHGLNEVTQASPELAPRGRHLLMSHQRLKEGRSVEEEAKEGIGDLKSLLPGFKENCSILAVQSYKNHWPVNRAPSGIAISPLTPVENLFNVGDAIKPLGFMETEGVAAGVEEALGYILG